MSEIATSLHAASGADHAPLLFRRRLTTSVLDRQVRVELEDDFHGFSLVLCHDGADVTEIDAEPYRHPWTSCAAAPVMLQGLIGEPLCGNLFDIIDGQPTREHCTHLFDMAGLAIATAVWGRGHDYRIQADIFGPDQMEIMLHTDGERRLAWTVENGAINTPATFAGRSVRGGFAEWARGEGNDEGQAELLLLRRAVMVASGKAAGPFEAQTPAEVPAKLGACFAFQPRRLDEGRRVPDGIASFAARGVLGNRA